MKIGITLHPYGEKKPAGLGRAIFEIVHAMLEIDRENEYTIFLKNTNLKPDLPGNNWKVAKLTAGAANSLDVCVFNTPVMPWWYGIFGRAKKSIVIAYDFAYLQYSPSRFLKFIHSLALKKANLIIPISESTKNDLINIFKISSEKIKVIYLGFNKIREIPPKPLNNSPAGGLPDKFFLFLGAIKERKNVLGIVKAFGEFKKLCSGEHKLVIAGNGSGEYYEKILRYIKDNNLSENIIFLGQITDANLSYLYQHTEALVYPSFIEGFGLPILEAQDYGLPVVTSMVSSLAEVAGDGAILVDPYNALEIAEAMKKISQDKNFRQALIEKGYANSKKFSWQKTAEEILSVL